MIRQQRRYDNGYRGLKDRKKPTKYNAYAGLSIETQGSEITNDYTFSKMRNKARYIYDRSKLLNKSKAKFTERW